MNKQDVVLLITEGEKLDIRILRRIKVLFFPNEDVRIFPICLNIYNLYKKIIEYSIDDEYPKIFNIIKEIIQEQPASNNFDFLALNRKHISQIFLFFDFDGHDNLVEKYPNCINEMLTLFNNETGNGKLYINYPMIESYKHPIKNKVEILDIFTEVHYKTFVAGVCNKNLENIGKLNKSDWLELFLPHLKSTNDLFHQEFKLPSHYSETQIISQPSIYAKQKEKYIEPNKQIMVLSSFSWFLLEYLGENLFNQWQEIDNQEATQ